MLAAVYIEVPGSVLTNCAVKYDPGQADMHVPLSSSSMVRYWTFDFDALRLGR